ncbi:MAG: HAMP domain-containing histidine kinase [Candidatus Diapherotrites archaeon]|nr:HAMP domain-containing histidine kinase [Candidatus Diapherotrites archaeon]
MAKNKESKEYLSKEYLLPWAYDRHDLLNYLQMAAGYVGLVDGKMEKDIRDMKERLDMAKGYLIQQKLRHKPFDIETSKPYHPELDKDEEEAKLASEIKEIHKRVKKVLRKIGDNPSNEYLRKGRMALEDANRLLEVQKARLEGRVIPYREASLKEVIERVVSKHQRNADFEVELDPEVNLKVSGSHFERALDNLVINSKRAFSEWKERTGEKPRIKISLNKKDSDVLLHISDNGPGFSEDVLKRDPFKLGVTSKERKKGGGTGLAIVKNIVESHGGSIHILDKRPGAHFEMKFRRISRKR